MEYLFQILLKNWLFQGVVGGVVTTIITTPFVGGYIKNIFINNKIKRIQKAQREIIKEYISDNVNNRDFNTSEFNNKAKYIFIKYNLPVKDVFKDYKMFKDLAIKYITSINLLNDESKQKLINQISDCKYTDLFLEDNNKTNFNGEENASKLNDEESNNSTIINDVDATYNSHACLKNDELIYVRKVKIFIRIAIFLVSFLVIDIIGLLLNAYGITSIVLLNVLIISIILIPILINGILHLQEFDSNNKVMFYIILFILVLNILNFGFIIINIQ